MTSHVPQKMAQARQFHLSRLTKCKRHATQPKANHHKRQHCMYFCPTPKTTKTKNTLRFLLAKASVEVSVAHMSPAHPPPGAAALGAGGPLLGADAAAGGRPARLGARGGGGASRFGRRPGEGGGWRCYLEGAETWWLLGGWLIGVFSSHPFCFHWWR